MASQRAPVLLAATLLGAAFVVPRHQHVQRRALRGFQEIAAELKAEPFCLEGVLPSGGAILFRTGKGWQSIPIESLDTDALTSLQQACSPSPFGKGSRTVVDTTYRNALELTPDRVHCTLQTEPLVSVIQRGLFPTTQIQLEFDKLSVYPQGGFFKKHKDTPVKANLLGSLVLCLPHQFQGGELVIRSPAGDATVADWASQSPRDVQWAAFFADCEHEVKPVAQGARVTLHYHVLAEAAPPLPKAQANERTVQLLQELFEVLDLQGPVAIPLLHDYSLATLREASLLEDDAHALLKGADLQIFLALQQILSASRLPGPTVTAAFLGPSEEGKDQEEIFVAQKVPQDLPYVRGFCEDGDLLERWADGEWERVDIYDEENGIDEDEYDRFANVFQEWMDHFEGMRCTGLYLHRPKGILSGLQAKAYTGNSGVELNMDKAYSTAAIVWELPLKSAAK